MTFVFAIPLVAILILGFIAVSKKAKRYHELPDLPEELPPAQFAQFTEALDRPAQAIPALQRLFTEKSVIERDAL